jgi:tetratricopeptide (TPR) repeat protein
MKDNKNQVLMKGAAKMQREGNSAQAERVYREIIAATPEFDPAYHALGLLAYENKQANLAIDLINHAIEINDDVLLYQSNLCEILRLNGRLEDALEVGTNAVSKAPENVIAHYNLALTLADSGQINDAIASYQRILELDPGHTLAWNNLGAALETIGDKANAKRAYQYAIASGGKHAESHNNLAALLTEAGELETAIKHFNAAIQLQPGFVQAHQNLSTLKTYTKEDPHFKIMQSIAPQDEKLFPDQKLRFKFAYAKALEDVGDYEQAFSYYEQANRLKFSTLSYNDAGERRILKHIIELFNKELFDRKRFSSSDDHAPVFIVGMPRSGTTLVEQILSSHKDIFGAGEIRTLDELVRKHLAKGKSKGLFADVKPGLAGVRMEEIASDYISHVRALAPDALRICDKMTANYYYIGLIHLMLPRAKIIHVMRDPMDSCFSCFSRLFIDGVNFSYDLKAVGNYYLRYMDLMKHWHNVLPSGSILDVHYEDVVADVETQTRKILQYIDLPWDENCLSFHENKRLVKTASLAQVQQPIYSSSVGRWQRFEAQLQSLHKIVKKYRSF